MSNIRPACATDAPAIADIYNYYVRHTAITFDESEWTEADALAKIDKLNQSNYPFLVYYDGDELLGYSYLSQWNAHSAFKTTAETTIYLAPKQQGKGLGTTLLRHLLEVTDPLRFHCLIACICIPHDASIALHEKFGFTQVSTFKEVGYKFNQWRDVGHWCLYL